MAHLIKGKQINWRKSEDTSELKKQRLKSMLENDHELLNEVVKELRREKIIKIIDKIN